jgi:hypothetical protein
MSLTDALKTDIFLSGDMGKSAAGDLATTTGLANFKQAMIHRIVTVPGTLVHKPTYGVGIGLYQNGLSSFSKQQKLATNIIDQLKQDPRVASITSVAIDVNDDNPDLTVVKLLIVPVGYTEQQIVFTPFTGGSGQ